MGRVFLILFGCVAGLAAQPAVEHTHERGQPFSVKDMEALCANTAP